MTKAVIVVLVALTLLGVARQLAGWWRRERVVRGLDASTVRRMVRGVSMRVLVTGVKHWRGLDSRRRTGLTGDLVLQEGRFLLVTDRGVLLDLAADGDQGIRSARCTGPGRLVIEGETGRDDGLYRFEMVVQDAQGWAADLAPFARGEEGARFASFRAAKEA